jgi:hypothetical protein
MGKSIGWVDIHLLTSVTFGGDALLWTRDKRLADLAAILGLAFQEGWHVGMDEQALQISTPSLDRDATA